MIKYVDGQPVEMTADEVAEFEAGREELRNAVPVAVEAWQAKRALVDSGHYALVESAIAALGDDAESLSIKVDWACAKTFRRDWPALVALAAQLEMDSDDLDALFVHAATL